MKYFVKNPDGELTFGSIHELRAMFQQGLVGPDDDVRAEDSPLWRKAAAVPELRAFAASRKDGGHFIFAVVSLICLSGALYALIHFHNFIIAAVLTIPVIGMSTRAFTRSIKRERS
jgi:hypothetical protein